MADFSIAFNWMMDNEDAPRKYNKVPDVGGYAIGGINSASFPKEFKVIDGLSGEDRANAIYAFYQKNFWNTWYEQLTSDDLAKRVFDAAVNMGPGTAVKLLQQAINVTADGGWGSKTVTAANNDEDAWQKFIFLRVQHYQDIVKAKPMMAVYLSQWETRAQK